MENNPYVILIVDDNRMNREIISRRLSKRGFSIQEAVDGQQAFEIIQQEKIHLVILDIMLPDISGYDILKILRQTYSQKELPVIVSSANDNGEDITRAMELGANDYIKKPIDFKATLASIQKHLA